MKDVDLMNKINELEMKLAFQDDLLQSLNDMVAKQDQEIQKLWLAKQRLNEELKSLKNDGISPENEVPPHY